MTVPAGVFDFNPNDVETGLPVFDKNSYEIEVGEPKAFLRAGKADANGKMKADNHGVMYRTKIATGSQAGKPYLVNCYMHTPESQGFAKQFLMAALGFKPKDHESEKKFNEKYSNVNWKYDPSTKSAGDAWHLAKNQRLIVDLDVRINAQTQEREQVLVGYRPLSAA